MKGIGVYALRYSMHARHPLEIDINGGLEIPKLTSNLQTLNPKP